MHIRRLLIAIICGGLALSSFFSPASAQNEAPGEKEAKMQVRHFPAPPVPEYVIDFANVDGVAIDTIHVSGFQDGFPITREGLCEETRAIIAAKAQGKAVTVYGCDEKVPERDVGDTMFLNIKIQKANNYLYKGKLKSTVVYIDVYAFRLRPYRSIYPRFVANLTLPAETGEEWDLFEENYAEIYRSKIEDIAVQLKLEK